MNQGKPIFTVRASTRRTFCVFLLLFSMVVWSVPAPAQSPQAASTQVQLEQLADMNTAIQAIFSGKPPDKYQAVKGKAFTGVDGTTGYTLLMANASAKTWAFMVDVRKSGPHEGTLLTKGKLKEVARQVLTHYMNVPQPCDIDADLESLDLPSERRGIARLTTADADGFVRPEIITRLHFASGRTVILLLGLPSTGVRKGKKPNFDDAYGKMESEAKRIIMHTGLSDTLTPSEAYMLWRLRQIFW